MNKLRNKFCIYVASMSMGATAYWQTSWESRIIDLNEL